MFIVLSITEYHVEFSIPKDKYFNECMKFLLISFTSDATREITYEPQEDIMVIGRVVTCSATGNPPPRYRWVDQTGKCTFCYLHLSISPLLILTIIIVQR